MRKSIVIILAVAVIGALGVYGKSHSQPVQTTDPSAVQSANTTSTGADSSSDNSSTYKDGNYTGSSQSTPYGDVQVAVVISGGKITDVNFLRMPDSEGHSQEVTIGSKPLLEKQTLRNQNSQVDFITGATSTSEAYEQSLQAALNRAA
jgi:uncharacterized protein with FMN-binding domain